MFERIEELSDLMYDLTKSAMQTSSMSRLCCVAISSHEPAGLMRVRFSSRTNVYVQSVTISPDEFLKSLKANFTFIERHWYRGLVKSVAMEAILIFVNNLCKMTDKFPDRIFDEWRYLSSEEADRNDQLYQRRLQMFTIFMKDHILPSSTKDEWLVSCDAIKDGRKQRKYRERIFRIIGDVILKEIHTNFRAI